MKKKLILVIGIILLVISIALGIHFYKYRTSDAYKFKKAYEEINNKVLFNNIKYQELNIPKNNKVKYSSLKETIEVLENGTGLIYFGFPNCPWCRGMLPVLLDVVHCSCLENVLYVDMTDMRDVFEVIDGKIVKKQEASEEYYKLLEIMDEILSEYTIEKDGQIYEVGEKRIYVPLVVGVKNGEIVGAFETIELEEGQTAFDTLSEKQENEYRTNFEQIIEEITKQENVCTNHC